MNKNIKVCIVGAGIQGVSNALFLLKKGFNVTMFDRDNPGSQAASYGLSLIHISEPTRLGMIA